MKQLIVKNLTIQFREIPIIEDASFSIDAGEIVGLIGQNGSGKTTILKAIFGLIKPDHGEILLENKNIIYLPQGKRIFSSLTVEENLKMNIFCLKNKNDLTIKIAEALNFFPPLKMHLKTKAGNLSGGEQQMLALSRIIIAEPKLALLDEPSIGLTENLVAEIFQKIKGLNLKHNTTMLIVEHNIEALSKIVDCSYVLNSGKIELLTDKKIH